MLRILVCMISASALLVPQSELVILKEGTKLYHRPGCPVVRDGVNVVALSRAQAESRGYTAHADCAPDKSPPADSAGGASKPPRVSVFVDGSKYYHRKDCAKLGASPKTMELERAGKTYWPCPACKPPIRRKNVEPAVPGTGRRGG